MREIQGNLEGEGLRVAIVTTQWYEDIINNLLEGALAVLDDAGVNEDDITVIRVPGAFELPLACDQVAGDEHYDAVIALGAVIRGETPHFDYVAGECARGLSQTALEYGVPVAFGVITADTADQAEARAELNSSKNKGAEAASAALEMASLLAQLSN